MIAASRSRCSSTWRSRAARSMLPSGSHGTTTTRMPAITALAALVPCALDGMRQTSRCDSPRSWWYAWIARSPAVGGGIASWFGHAEGPPHRAQMGDGRGLVTRHGDPVGVDAPEVDAVLGRGGDDGVGATRHDRGHRVEERVSGELDPAGGEP